jgi:hypothetical protein
MIISEFRTISLISVFKVQRELIYSAAMVMPGRITSAGICGEILRVSQSLPHKADRVEGIIMPTARRDPRLLVTL